jgi:hypothetical protein
MSADVTRWYRCEFDRDGNRVEIALVPGQGTSQDRVFFVRAEDEEGAWRRAWNWRSQVVMSALRRERVAADLCPRCGTPMAGETRKCCARCLEKQKEYDGRARAKKRGENVAPLDRRARRVESREELHDDTRLRILREVHRRYLATQGDRRAFSNWLLGEIEKLAQKEVA